MKLSAALLGTGLAALLAGCGIKLPDTAQYLQGCERFDASLSQMPDAAIFYAATNLPDCRKDDRMRLAAFRYNYQTLGYVPLRIGDEPWIDPAPARLEQADWWSALDTRINAPGNDGRLLIFVHGYNNDFTDAVERAYKLSQMNHAGVPVLAIAWPSRNRVQSYVYDEASVAWSQAYLNRLLLSLTEKASDITIVGHSMGSRAVIDAVTYLNARGEIADGADPAHVRRIVLASPDVDRDRVMREKGAIDDLLEYDREVLIYASYLDAPIRASRIAHGYGRLGSSDCRYDVTFERQGAGQLGRCHMTIERPNLSVVETSAVHVDDVLKHSDFVDSPQVARDLSAFLRGCAQFPWRQRETGSYLDTRTGEAVDLVGEYIADGDFPPPCAGD